MIRSALRRGTVIATLTATALSLTAGAASASVPHWRTVPPPAVPAGDSAGLTSVSMTGPSDGWAVGFAYPNKPPFAFRQFAAHWDGHRWRTAALPHGLPKFVRLNGVAALSPSDAWAVGDSPHSSSVPLIMHWNGHRWATVPSAPIPKNGFSELLGVAAHSPTDVWAVGNAENLKTGLTRTVIEHWDGHRWRLVPSPNLGNQSFLTAVTTTSTGAAWAVGGSLTTTGAFVIRWAGHAWVTAATPRTSADINLESVTAVSPAQVWAVGESASGTSPSRPYALHWNGHTWASVSVPNAGPAQDQRKLISITATGLGQLDAVGYDNGAQLHPFYAHWDGHRWSVRVGPPNGAALSAVSSDGRRQWAVGSKDVPHSTFALTPFIQVSG